MNGSVTIGAVTGGTAPYTYNFNNTGYPGSTSYTGLAAGTYPLEVKDANGCTFLTSVTITNIPGATAIASTVFNETCGVANGSVTIGSSNWRSCAISDIILIILDIRVQRLILSFQLELTL